MIILDGTRLIRAITLEPGRPYYPTLLPKS
jgi:hypothetical protein